MHLLITAKMLTLFVTKDRMEKLKNTLEKLDYKIEIYENNILKKEKELEKISDE